MSTMTFRVAVALWACVLLRASDAVEEATCMIRVADYNDVAVVPESYRVLLRTEFKSQGFFSRLIGRKANQKFKGNVTMAFNAVKAAPNMTLHAVNIELSDAEYRKLPRGDWRPLSIAMDPQKQVAVFSPNGGISSGPGEFRCKFKGKMHFGLAEPGLQIVNLTGPDGTQSVGVMSNFLPEGARRVFPCVDFPKYKAKFALSLAVPKNLEVFSNTEQVSEVSLKDDYKMVTFAETPAMSTFALGFVVGKYHSETRNLPGGVQLRVLISHARKDFFGNLKNASDAVQTMLPVLQDYTGTPLPGPAKLDIIGVTAGLRTISTYGLLIVPEDILLSENWNYRQDNSSTPEIRLKGHLAYALAKVWFGADITPEYWDNIWLSEGVSTFLSEMINSRLQPPRTQWIKYDRSPIRRMNILDQINDSPVKFTFVEPDSVMHSSLVRLATQGKASLYLWMLYQFIGDEQFRKGTKLYASKHKGGLVKAKDFAKDFTEATGVPADWLRQIVSYRGSVTLHVDCEQQGNNRILKLRQIYFRKRTLPCPRNDSIWAFPVVVDTEDGKTHHQMVDQPLTTIIVPGVAWKTKWAKLNQLTSYYRVLYSENCLENFGLYKGLGSVKHDYDLRSTAGKISPYEKLMILDDLSYLENLYRRVVVRPDDSEAAKLTDHYDFTRIRNGILQAGEAPAAG
ncbi:puromycin-sensitive aminopeptidase-like [Tropilaelaps mercedesae]|uniref:Puromycin-sensitive aminopeptidase-like n=1 Tax=Tropilaelaps mercedesae TaxID=418985 RepID=A0A1V9XMH8_9ACAR|nr:puromycin-sensitive aminopeptidase-like [Tropilaelaps mercedesae]